MTTLLLFIIALPVILGILSVAIPTLFILAGAVILVPFHFAMKIVQLGSFNRA